jgi:hypothetical protein
MILLEVPVFAPLEAGPMIALAGLFALCGLIFALGAVRLVRALVEALFWPFKHIVGGIPYVGAKLSYPFVKVEAKITNLLGSAANALDKYIGWTWHNLSALVRWFGHEIEGLAHDLWLMAAVIPGLVSQVVLHRFVGAVLHPIRTVQEIERQLLRAERAALAAIRHTVIEGVWPRLHGLEHGLERVIEHDIASLRARTHALERKTAREFRWLRTRPWLVVTTAFVGAVAIALAKMGLGCLTGRNGKRLVRGICRIPTGLLDGLLGLGFGLFAFSHICDLIRGLVPLAQKVLPALISVLSAPAAALCDGAHSAAPPLAIETTALPPVASPLPLD